MLVLLFMVRVLIYSREEEVVVQLVNQGEQASLVQSWIDDSILHYRQKNSGAIYADAASGAVAAESGQQIKIEKCLIAYRTTKKVCFI